MNRRAQSQQRVGHQTAPATPRFLTYRQAAELLGVSTKTISRRVRRGALAVVVDGGVRRIPAGAFEKYVAARTVPDVDARRSPNRHSAVHSHVASGRLNSSLQTRRRVQRLWEPPPDPDHLPGA